MVQSSFWQTDSHSPSEDISFFYEIKVSLSCFQQPITRPYSVLCEWNLPHTLQFNNILLVFPWGLFITIFQILYLFDKSKGLSLKCVIILIHILDIFHHLGFCQNTISKLALLLPSQCRDQFSLMDQTELVPYSYFLPDARSKPRFWNVVYQKIRWQKSPIHVGQFNYVYLLATVVQLQTKTLLRLQVLITMTGKNILFWEVMPSSLVEIYQHFEGICSLQLHCKRKRQQVPQKCKNISTRLWM